MIENFKNGWTDKTVLSAEMLCKSYSLFHKFYTYFGDFVTFGKFNFKLLTLINLTFNL